MLMRMTRSTGGPHGSACAVGDVVDVPEHVARAWVAQSRAVPVSGAPVLDTGLVSVHGDPGPESAPAPAKRRR